MENSGIARILFELADIGEIRAENPFKVRALRNAAAAIETLPYDVAPLATDPKRLCEIRGVGPGIAQKIAELCQTGSLKEHTQLATELPPSLLELLKVEGVGVKTARLVHDRLGVRTVADLAKAAEAGKLRELPRMSAKTEAKILQAIAEHGSRTDRFLLSAAEAVLEPLLKMLRSVSGVKRVEPAGSLRRQRETIGDLDLLVCCEKPVTVMERFCRAGQQISRGEKKAAIRLVSGMQVDLRIVPEESFGAALHYFTGSKAHNIAIRTLAIRRGLTINEYGVFKAKPDGTPSRRLSGEAEEDIFAAVELPWIPPELREDRGEIEAAMEGRLPQLIEIGDICGDLHMHTTATDGKASIEQMAAAAIAAGKRYIAITDHSKNLAMTNGLDEVRLSQHVQAISKIAARMKRQVRILSGIEVDILRDGSLDLSDDSLRGLDVVIGSIHSYFKLSKEEMTARVIRAIESGRIDIIGHPICVLFTANDAYLRDFDLVVPSDCVASQTLDINRTALDQIATVLKADISPSSQLSFEKLLSTRG